MTRAIREELQARIVVHARYTKTGLGEQKLDESYTREELIRPRFIDTCIMQH